MYFFRRLLKRKKEKKKREKNLATSLFSVTDPRIYYFLSKGKKRKTKNKKKIKSSKSLVYIIRNLSHYYAFIVFKLSHNTVPKLLIRHVGGLIAAYY